MSGELYRRSARMREQYARSPICITQSPELSTIPLDS